MKLIALSILFTLYVTYATTEEEAIELVEQMDEVLPDYLVHEGPTPEPTIGGPYIMGSLITCLEQNEEDPISRMYRDPIWACPKYPDLTDCTDECAQYPDLCERFNTMGPHPGCGDVCDHTDPITGNTRNACYFNTIYGETVNTEKTWSFKCWYIESCPLKGADGHGRNGCRVSNKRINCCCQDDFCTADDLIIQNFAKWGNPDNYPPDFDEMCEYDFGEWYVEFTVPGYEHCGNDPDAIEATEEPMEPVQTEEDEHGGEGEQGQMESTKQEMEGNEENEETEDNGLPPAASPAVPPIVGGGGSFWSFAVPPAIAPAVGAPVAAHDELMRELDEEHGQSAEVVNVADILLIFTYFIIGIVFLGVGVFVGSKWKSNVLQQQQMIKEMEANQLDC